MRKMTFTLFSLLGTAFLAGASAQAQDQQQEQQQEQQDRQQEQQVRQQDRQQEQQVRQQDLQQGSQQQGLQQQDQGIAEVQVTAPMNPMQRLSPDRMADSRGNYQDVRGAYPMSHGQWLNVGTANHQLVAELNERGPVELVQVGENKFVAKGQPLTLVFYQGVNGDQIQVTYVPDEALASATPAYVTVALNR